MTASLLFLLATYLAVGALIAHDCRLESRIGGWGGQIAVAAATLILCAIWPVIAFQRGRARLRAPRS